MEEYSRTLVVRLDTFSRFFGKFVDDFAELFIFRRFYNIGLAPVIRCLYFIYLLHTLYMFVYCLLRMCTQNYNFFSSTKINRLEHRQIRLKLNFPEKLRSAQSNIALVRYPRCELSSWLGSCDMMGVPRQINKSQEKQRKFSASRICGWIAWTY